LERGYSLEPNFPLGKLPPLRREWALLEVIFLSSALFKGKCPP